MHNIAILAGDGIGPEVMEQAVRVLKVIEKRFSLNITYTYAPVGGVAIDTEGTALPQKTISACKKADAILFGSVGGPKWDTLPPNEQPERGALLPLRKHFDLFANLRPVIIFSALRDVSPLKNNVLPNYLDLLIVRELTGGLYFGKPKETTETYAMDTLIYQKHEVERIAHVAFNAARKRNNHVVSVDKANVLTSMVFWRNIVSQVATQYPDVTVSHMYVDNAAMQLIVNPGQFDVLLCPNSFGDILSDEASVFAGSLGLLPSASLGKPNKHAHTSFGLYEPSGGSAPDIAGQDVANPIAQILSAAMLLKYSLGLHKAHDFIVKSVETVIDQGYRTKDITTQDSITVHTTKMGSLISDTLDKL